MKHGGDSPRTKFLHQASGTFEDDHVSCQQVHLKFGMNGELFPVQASSIHHHMIVKA